MYFTVLLQDILYYEQLKTNVLHYDLLVDSLIYKVTSGYSELPAVIGNEFFLFIIRM